MGVEQDSRKKALARAEAAGFLLHAVAAEPDAKTETQEQHFVQAVEEIFQQAFDTFGLNADGTITRVKTDAQGGILEHLQLNRKNDKGDLIIGNRLLSAEVYLGNLYGKDVHATFMNGEQRLNNIDALDKIRQTLIAGSVIPSNKTILRKIRA